FMQFIASFTLFLAVCCGSARAQVISYEIESLDKLYQNMDALGTGSKLPVNSASLTGMLGPWLDHIDSTRSIRMQIYLDHKKQGQSESTTDDLGKLEDLMSFITVVPVKDRGDALLGATTNLYTETKHDGFRHHLSGAKAPGAPGQQISISVGEKRGLVFISNSSNLLDRVISSYPTAGYPAGIA
ncbi:MAG: hypothetical protein GWN81_24810, partial [Phycisphaerae bacterium]|nr:hypothetical protein [Phycisphaerae bacterium]